MAHNGTDSKWYDKVDIDDCVIVESDKMDEALLNLQEMAEEGIYDDTAFFIDEIDRDGVLSLNDINEAW